MSNSLIYINAVKACSLAACFDPTERLCKSFAPLKEKHFWPFADFFGEPQACLGMRRFLELRCEFFDEHVTQVLWSKLVLRFVDHYFRFLNHKFIIGFPTHLIDK